MFILIIKYKCFSKNFSGWIYAVKAEEEKSKILFDKSY